MSAVTSHRRPSPRLLLAACLVIVYVVWGSTYLAIRIGLQDIPPLLLSAARNLTAGVVLFIFSKARGAPWPSRVQWRNAAAMGLLMVSVGNGLVCVAEQQASSGVAAIVFACAPAFALLLGWVTGRRPHRLEWAGLALGSLGVALLYLDHSLLAKSDSLTLLLLATLGWSLAAVVQPRLNMPAGGISAPAQMLCGGACLMPLALLQGERWPAHVGTSAWLALGYLVVFGSILGYSAYVYLLGNASTTLATSNAYVNPVVAAVLGAAFVSETLSQSLIAALAAVLASLALILSAQRSADAHKRGPQHHGSRPATTDKAA